MDATEFIAKLGIREVKWTNDSARELEALLKNKVLQEALAVSFASIEGKKLQLLQLNYANPESAIAAAGIQGQVQGILTVLDTLVSMSQTEEESEDGRRNTESDAA